MGDQNNESDTRSTVDRIPRLPWDFMIIPLPHMFVPEGTVSLVYEEGMRVLTEAI